MEEMKVLAVAPCYDEASSVSLKWYERLREAIKDKVKVQELLREVAVRSAFESNVETFKPDVIVFYNHGSDDCLCAQGGQECVLDSKNVDKVAGKVIYTLACLSARKLGAQAYAYNCIYVGYIETFAFTIDDEQLFCSAANSGFIAYVEGEDDWAKIKALMVEAFNKAMQQTNDPWAKMWLQWDRDALRVYAPNADSPETKCLLRKAALKTFGSKIGWRLTRKAGLGIILFLVGYGITLHAVASELYCKGGYPEILKPQGEWIGLTLIFIGFILLTYQHFKWLKCLKI